MVQTGGNHAEILYQPHPFNRKSLIKPKTPRAGSYSEQLGACPREDALSFEPVNLHPKPKPSTSQLCEPCIP